MGGGLFQLVSSGTQDKYLTGNPQITFFKSVYRRHTNFSIECIQQEITGDISTSTTESIGKVLISKGNGDLLNKVYVSCEQTSVGVNGDKLIKQAELIIGGALIDKHTTEWMQVWNELSLPESKAAGYKYMSGGYNDTLSTKGNTDQSTIIVPLLFWFCRYPGLSIPLLALQYHDVEIKFTWGINSDVNKDGSNGDNACEVWADYIYLDTEERKRFSQSEHEYLIEQVQINDFTNQPVSSKYKLEFTHPVKELIWTEGNTGSSVITNQKMNITLNGTDRMALQSKEYYQLKQPLDHHTSIPGYNIKQTGQPKLLSIPISLSSGGDNVIVGALSATGHDENPLPIHKVGYVNTNNKLGIFNDTIVAGTEPSSSNKKVRIGDLIQITHVNAGLVEEAEATVDSAVTTVIAQVTNVVYTALKEEYITFDKNVLTTTPDIKDSIIITLIARVQDPQSRCSSLQKNIYVYSFSLNPEEHQPSGTLNFSRIDSCKLSIEEAKQIDRVYAVNYNVLRIGGGTANLAFTN